MKSEYRYMVDTAAWKDIERFLGEIEADATKYADDVPIRSLTVAEIAESRGMRKVIRMLKEHVEQHLI